jgi:hypothetical protein
MRQQSWFVLFVIGAGFSIALVETHRQLTLNDISAGPPEALFVGHLISSLFFSVRCLLLEKTGGRAIGSFLNILRCLLFHYAYTHLAYFSSPLRNFTLA